MSEKLTAAADDKEMTLDEMEAFAAAIPSAAQTFVPALIARIRELESASQPGSGEDTARLDYLIEEGAVVDTITNFENEKRYQLSWPDLGESQNAWYRSARTAIDAMIDAARATLPSTD